MRTHFAYYTPRMLTNLCLPLRSSLEEIRNHNHRIWRPDPNSTLWLNDVRMRVVCFCCCCEITCLFCPLCSHFRGTFLSLGLIVTCAFRSSLLLAFILFSLHCAKQVRVGEVGGHTLGLFGGLFGPRGRSILGHGYYGAFHRWVRTDEDDGTCILVCVFLS